MAKFDGFPIDTLIVSKFGALGRFSRFFTETGEGYSKQGHNTCCNDYSLNEIMIDPDTEVYIKPKRT